MATPAGPHIKRCGSCLAGTILAEQIMAGTSESSSRGEMDIHPWSEALMAHRRRPEAVEVVVDPLTRWVARWRDQAEECQRLYGDAARAHLISTMVDELLGARQDLEGMQLTYGETGLVMGWSVGTVRNKVAAGELRNTGTRGHPRIALRDLRLGLRAVDIAQAVLERRAIPAGQTETERVSAARARARARFTGGTRA